MFLTGVFPVFVYAMPALAGILMMAVVVECGYSLAWTIYCAISLLSMLVVPNKEAAVLFALFFGFYPIIRTNIEKLKFVFLRWIIKMIIFNVSVAAAYLVIIHVFGIAAILENVGVLGKYTVIALLFLGNITFVMYDILLAKLRVLYVNWFRPRFLRRFGL